MDNDINYEKITKRCIKLKIIHCIDNKMTIIHIIIY